MARIVVDVMPKPEILDPQGKAIVRAFAHQDIQGFAGVRQGKRFELEVDGEVTPELLETARRAAATMLSNPVIEDVVDVAVVDEEN
ncbi:phosphoribosylformylglycinamidine synthase subunit PurS [Kocuria palustris]|uniref:phosphoribosylformylglycinamidine synthase subunit PurS n=1 Tax=Kocuria palustris TaxID=71999 RepID=UPI0011A37062|nr:phosphoribosylformylglycinamidine synthase subunit PurS [Kocuria palustris]